VVFISVSSELVITKELRVIMLRQFWTLMLAFLVVLAVPNAGNTTFNGHVSIVNSVAFSSNGNLALSGSWDWTMRLWDLSTHKPIRKFKDHTLSVNDAVFSPDSKMVLSASADATLKLWKISDGKPFRTFKGHTGMVTAAAFAPNGKFILSGSTDQSLILWDLKSGAISGGSWGTGDPSLRL